MIITVSGTPGSGKSTVSKETAKRLRYKHYSAGDLMRKIAKRLGISLKELDKLAEKNKKIDEELDKETKKIAKGKKSLIIDGRMAWYFMPKSLKIFLTVNEKEAALRILQDIKKGKRKTEHKVKTLKDAVKEVRRRLRSEKKRYKKYYGIDYTNKKNYDFILNTTGNTVKETADEVIDFLKTKHLKNK